MKFKRSAVPAKVPSIADLALGELAINTYDGKLFLKKDDGTQAIVEVGSGGGGGLGTMATQDADAVAITGGTITGVTMDSITNHVGADHIHYKIKATQILAKGDVVKVTGFNAGENAFEVAKVSASTDIAVGVVYSALANGDLGSIINTGLLEGIDTSAFAIGTVLYPNTSGGFTSTKPTTGSYQALAFVVRSHAINGTILIEASEPQPTSLSQFTNDSGFITSSPSNFQSVQSVASASTITPNANTDTQVSVTALAVPATIASPSGTPSDAQSLVIRIKDDGTARALTWTTGSSGSFRPVGITLPTTTVATKAVYIGCKYNSTDLRWDAIALSQEA